MLGNPTTDTTKNYRLAELFRGFNLISEELLADLEQAHCPLVGPTSGSGSTAADPPGKHL